MKWIKTTFLLLALCGPLLAEPTVVRGSRLLDIKKSGKIKIGIQNEYRPFRIENPKPGYPGIDVELANALGEALEVEVEISYLPLDQLLIETNAGKLDVGLGGISSTLERARKVNFSDPYMKTTPAGLLARDSLPPESESVNYARRQFKSLSDLKYLGPITIGVRAGTANETLLRTDPDFQKHKIKVFQDRTIALAALESREIDLLVADDVYLRALLLKRPELMNRFLPLLDKYLEDHISMAIPSGDPELWNYLNFFIKEMIRTGRMQTIINKYFQSGAWF